MSRYRHKADGTPRTVASLATYSVYAVCLEAPAAHPDWQGKQWLRLDPTPWGLISHNQANKAFCERAAGWIAERVQEKEGGLWVGKIRNCRDDPQPEKPLSADEMRGLDTHVLNGPDGPGRRWLLQRQQRNPLPAIPANILKPVPPLFKANKWQDMGKAGPTRFEPDKDPELAIEPPYANQTAAPGVPAGAGNGVSGVSLQEQIPRSCPTGPRCPEMGAREPGQEG